MFRLKVKNGKKWITGINVYSTMLEVQTRQLELELVGIKSKIVDKNGGDLRETMA